MFDYIIAYHDQRPLIKIIQLLAVSSIDNVMQYYDLKRKKKQENTICVLLLFTYGSNEDSDEANDSLQMMNKNTIGRQNQEPL
jgi:type I restriction enzyme R subunit